MFDAKVQHRSDEISDTASESIQMHCNNLLERLSHERVEVTNVQRRIEEMSLESMELTQPKEEMVQECLIIIEWIYQQLYILKTTRIRNLNHTGC